VNEWIMVGAVVGVTVLALGGFGVVKSVLGGKNKNSG
jgi:VIT1/CCC1 family predicted Fe2+/Mn2+ transporter